MIRTLLLMCIRVIVSCIKALRCDKVKIHLFIIITYYLLCGLFRFTVTTFLICFEVVEQFIHGNGSYVLIIRDNLPKKIQHSPTIPV